VTSHGFWSSVLKIAKSAKTQEELLLKANEGIPEFKGRKKLDNQELNPEWLEFWKSHATVDNYRFYFAFLVFQRDRLLDVKIPELIDNVNRLTKKAHKLTVQISDATEEFYLRLLAKNEMSKLK
jgi:hypothetical protein